MARTHRLIIGWVRDHKGKILYRYPRKTMNCITTFSGGGFGNTTPYILEYEDIEQYKQYLIERIRTLILKLDYEK